MSSDSLAALRQHLGPKLGALAEQHLQHDLTESDRSALQSAATTVSRHAAIGSAVGLVLGVFLAARIRSNRRTVFAAFRAHEKPSALRFPDGREVPLPDVTPLVRPSRLGDLATGLLLGGGGLFLGGETGLLTGSVRARSGIAKDGASRERIERAFRKFQADALRAQADEVERNGPRGL